MINFDIYNIHSLVNRKTSKLLYRNLHIDKKDIKNILEMFEIKKTKKNIEIVFNQVTSEIKMYYADVTIYSDFNNNKAV